MQHHSSPLPAAVQLQLPASSSSWSALIWDLLCVLSIDFKDGGAAWCIHLTVCSCMFNVLIATFLSTPSPSCVGVVVTFNWKKNERIWFLVTVIIHPPLPIAKHNQYIANHSKKSLCCLCFMLHDDGIGNCSPSLFILFVINCGGINRSISPSLECHQHPLHRGKEARYRERWRRNRLAKFASFQHYPITKIQKGHLLLL